MRTSAISKQRADLIREEIELQGETEERLNALAEAQIEAAAAAQVPAPFKRSHRTSYLWS